MTAAEQLATAIQRVIEETAEKIAAAQAPAPTGGSMKTAEVATILGFSPRFVLQLARAGDLKSDGEGRGRRYRPEYVEDFRRRLKAANGRIWDVEALRRPTTTEGSGATASQ
jgi:hypothetical protein